MRIAVTAIRSRTLIGIPIHNWPQWLCVPSVVLCQCISQSIASPHSSSLQPATQSLCPYLPSAACATKVIRVELVGTRGNAIPVRKLQPHLEGTIVPFITHRPQCLPQRISTSRAFCSVSSASNNFSSWLSDHQIWYGSGFPCLSGTVRQTDYAPAHGNQFSTIIKGS